jgi:hypothetical protein
MEEPVLVIFYDINIFGFSLFIETNVFIIQKKNRENL